jgi:3-oxoacyl-[acyl-carrier-protein] synthase II
MVSLDHGLRGPHSAPATACATGLHAIGEAFRQIQRGDADLMVAGSAEACIDAVSINVAA